jgi:hypothetical protein
MALLITLAIFMWLGGYIYTTHTMSKTGRVSADLEKIVSPPTWLYYLCGVPVASGYPRGTMRLLAFRAQMHGLLLGLYVAVVNLWKPSKTEFLIGFALSVAIPIILTYYVAKYYAVSNRELKKKIRE